MRSQVWRIDTGGAKGSEIKGLRYAVVVSDDGVGVLPLKIVVPITSWKNNYSGYPWMVNLIPDISNGLIHESAVDTFQIRSIDKCRLLKKIGNVDGVAMKSIEDAITICLDL